MENVIKFTEEEMIELRTLNERFQEKVFQFGQFRLERMHLLRLVKELEDREEIAEKEYLDLQNLQTSILDKITKKYGEGRLDLENGTFIPLPSVTQKEKSTP
jgi:hypothetical protein